MNYITQLTEASRRFYKDDRLKPSHISLYIAIFQMANAHRFPKDLKLARNELMQLSKIKSPVTYYKCLKELKKWKYISYEASKSPLESSSISILALSTRKAKKRSENNASEHDQLPVQLPVQKLTKTTSKIDQLVAPYINIYKLYINNINSYEKLKNEIFEMYVLFFKNSFAEKFQEIFSEQEIEKEAEKFFNHFEAHHWKMAGKTPITDFRPVAKNWMIRAKEYKQASFQKKPQQNDLQVHQLSRDKNYNEPL